MGWLRGCLGKGTGEELLAKACEKAQVLNLSLQELQEMLELMYRDGQ